MSETENRRDWDVSERAADLHDDALVWDMVFVYEPDFENDHRMFLRWLDSGVDFVSVHPAGDRHNVGQAVQRIARCRQHVIGDDRYVLVDTIDDVFQAKNDGKLAVSLHLEGFRCLERDLNMVEIYHKLGVRFVHPVFNLVNSIGGGSADRIDIGLTKFGTQVVEGMNDVGMIVDGAHASHTTTMDMMEVSDEPVILSHVGCNALREHFRNVGDDQIRKCAQQGGVIGITSAGFYLGDTDVETYFEHIDHVARLVGTEHVGIAMDHMGPEGVAWLEEFIEERSDEWPGRDEGLWDPMDFVDPEKLPELTELMLQEGYSESEVRGVLGENWLRVCEEVWKPPE